MSNQINSDEFMSIVAQFTAFTQDLSNQIQSSTDKSSHAIDRLTDVVDSLKSELHVANITALRDISALRERVIKLEGVNDSKREYVSGIKDVSKVAWTIITVTVALAAGGIAGLWELITKT